MRARDNPFRTECLLQVRYRLQGMTWAELLSRCERLGYRAALVGAHGSGKTTLIENLEPRLIDRGFRTRFIRLDAEHRRFDSDFLKDLFAGLTERDILLFDGAEQMNPFAWHWFRQRSRGASGLIITTHQPGRLPTLWECRTSSELLARIAAELLGVEMKQFGIGRRLFFGSIAAICATPCAIGTISWPRSASWSSPWE
jgi:hypothetical protein